jgi:hypothetical protein
VGLGAVAAVVTLAGCSAANRPGPAVVSRVARPPSSSAASSAVIPPPPAGHTRTVACKTSRLKIDLVWSGAALGTVGGRIGFTNLWSRPCRLAAWPVLKGIPARGKPSTAIDRRMTMFGPDTTAAPSVTLRPGAMAEAVFTGGDEPGPGATTCPPSYRLLRITPPGNSQPVTIPAWIAYYHHDLPSCSGIWVSEVVPPSAVNPR